MPLLQISINASKNICQYISVQIQADQITSNTGQRECSKTLCPPNIFQDGTKLPIKSTLKQY